VYENENDLEMAYPWGCTLGHRDVKKFITLMKLEGSSPHTQDIPNGTCSEPDKSTQHPHILLL
jgi:hypothetical protein